MSTVGLTSDYVLNALQGELGDYDLSGSGRWTQAQLLSFIDRGNKRVVRDVLFPDCRIELPTVANVQLYQFPLMLKTDRVYVGGQLIVPTDVSTLGGQQIGYWDSTGQQPPQPYADAPTNTTGQAAPQWVVTTPLSYPTTQGQWITPKPDAEPWYCGSPPRCYWRGGWLGIVPIPTNNDPVTTIAVEGVRQPDIVNALGQTLTTPENFLDAIVWAATSCAKFADDGSRAAAQNQQAEAFYEREKRKLIEWRGLYPGEQRNGPKVNTLRPAYAGYHIQRSRGGRW
jgi:hypothetical protein